MIRKRIYFILLTMVMACTVMTSCSEDDGVEDEFADWQLRNDSYFNNLTDSIQKLRLETDPHMVERRGRFPL